MTPDRLRPRFLDRLADGGQAYLAGHSHGTALGLKTRAQPGPDAQPIPDFDKARSFDGPWPRTEAYWDALVAAAADRVVFLTWRGNQHLRRFLFVAGPSFDVHLPDDPDPFVEADVLVPASLVRDVFSPEMVELDAVLRRLAAVRGCTPVVLGTPPPKGDDDALRAILVREGDFHPNIWAKRLGQTLETVTFTDRRVRRKLWRIVQDQLAGTAEAAGCAFVPVPAVTQDDEGFLKPAYWAADASHANRAYGYAVWTRLTSEIER